MTTAQARTEQRRRVPWFVIVSLLGLVALSIVLHLWALKRDLPLQDIDESIFVRRAVNIAATGDLNPHWFGHPGSTVIYPIAGLVRVWNTLVHQGAFFAADPGLVARFRQNPTEFYVIGRLWTIALSVGAVPLVFLVGRRAFNTRVALVAAAVWVVLPVPVHFGRIVRTDSAGVFFGLLALYLCLRVLDEPRGRWCVLAGLSVGLAVSSRYFMLALVPSLLVAAIYPHRHALRAALRAGGIALGSTVVGFAISTPFFFIDWHTAWRSLQAENEPMVGQSRLTPLGNLRWYLGTAIPASLTWPLVALSVAGIVMVLWRRRPAQLLLLALPAVFLAAISASTLHWQRWVIVILPVLVLFAGAALDDVAQSMAELVRHGSRPSLLKPVVPIALVAVTAVLAFHPAIEVVDANRNDALPSTRGAALDWLTAHVHPGSRTIADPSTLITSENTRLPVDNRFSPRTDTLSGYRARGYDYLVIDRFKAAEYTNRARSHRRETAFYRSMDCDTLAVASFRPSATRRGSPMSVYRLDAPPPPEVTQFCAATSPGS
jgi:Dolichyl-phosphate-mannose-protein mannosyltransferase